MTSAPETILSMDNEYFSLGEIAFVDWAGNTVSRINADGSNLKPLAKINNYGNSVTWSPDGHWIAYDSEVGPNNYFEGNTTQILVMDSNGGNKKQITNSNHVKFDLAWSPLDQEIFFSTQPQENVDIISVQKDGRYLRKVTSLIGHELASTFSPDGSKIAFQSASDHSLAIDHLEIIQLSDGIPKPVIDFPMNYGGIDWSPDGTTITFSSYYHGPSQNYWSSKSGLMRTVEPENSDCGDIYTVNVTGTQLSQLTHLPGCAKSPVWSPDGRYIAFLANTHSFSLSAGVEDKDWQIFIMNKDGSGITQLTHFNVSWGIRSLAWSRVPGLRIGQTYRLTELGNKMILRQGPSLKANQVTQLKTGAKITVLSAPMDAENYFWRQVKLEDGMEGWVQEVGGWFAPVDGN